MKDGTLCVGAGRNGLGRKRLMRPPRLHKRNFVEPADLIADAQPLIKLNQIGAASQQKMLAIIQDFAGSWMFIGRRSASDVRAFFEYCDLESGISQRAARSEASQATADDRNRLSLAGDCCSYHAQDKAAGQHGQFFPRAQADAFGEYVIIAIDNLLQQAAVNFHQHP